MIGAKLGILKVDQKLSITGVKFGDQLLVVNLRLQLVGKCYCDWMKDLVWRSPKGLTLQSAQVRRVLPQQIVHHDTWCADICRDLERLIQRRLIHVWTSARLLADQLKVARLKLIDFVFGHTTSSLVKITSHWGILFVVWNHPGKDWVLCSIVKASICVEIHCSKILTIGYQAILPQCLVVADLELVLLRHLRLQHFEALFKMLFAFTFD